MKKYFPITVEPACRLKWSWSTIKLKSGTTSSCHRVVPEKIDNFADFHNTPGKVADRKLMLDGKWPKDRGCEYCSKVEEAGGTSDRMFQNQIPGMYPDELDTNPTATTVAPAVLEVYFNNTCNMSCLYCFSGFSSKIETENNIHGRFEKADVVIENKVEFDNDAVREKTTENFWLWMNEHASELKRFVVLGGEPFFQTEFDRCLDFLEQHNNPNLEFTIISNLKVSPKKLTNILNRIKKLVNTNRIKRFDVTASIDCLGPEVEYVRYGIDVNNWKQNFELLVRQEWITLNINQTITVLSIKPMPDLIEYINQFEGRNIGHYFGIVLGERNSFLQPGIFAYETFAQDFKKIILLMKDETWQQQQSKKNMIGLVETLKSNPNGNETEIKKIPVFLNEIDRRRNLNWKKTFPWLEEYVV